MTKFKKILIALGVGGVITLGGYSSYRNISVPIDSQLDAAKNNIIWYKEKNGVVKYDYKTNKVIKEKVIDRGVGFSWGKIISEKINDKKIERTVRGYTGDKFWYDSNAKKWKEIIKNATTTKKQWDKQVNKVSLFNNLLGASAYAQSVSTSTLSIDHWNRYKNSGGDTWTNFVNGNGGTVQTGPDIIVGWQNNTAVGKWTYISRGRLTFPDILPDDASLSISTSSIWLFANAVTNATPDNPSFGLTDSSPVSDTVANNSDYENAGDDLKTGTIALNSLVDESFNEFPFISTTTNYISSSTYTNFSIRTLNDLYDNAPTDEASVDSCLQYFSASETAGEEPYIEIAYTLDGGGGGNNPPTISSVTDTDPVNAGANNTFSVDWNDADTEGIKMLICQTDGIATATPSCTGGEFCANDNDFDLTDPITCTYATSTLGTYDWWAFVCDNEVSCSAGYAGSTTVQAVPPTNNCLVPDTCPWVIDSTDNCVFNSSTSTDCGIVCNGDPGDGNYHFIIENGTLNVTGSTTNCDYILKGTNTKLLISNNDYWTFVMQPDTQDMPDTCPATYDKQVAYLASSTVIQKKNIKWIAHMGDFVNDGGNTTWWSEADDAQSQLNTANTPYSVTLGNHDYDSNSCVANRTTNNFDSAFPYSDFNSYGDERGTYDGGIENSYFTFTALGDIYMVIGVEFEPRDAVLAWATSSIESVTHDHIIFFTHNYMNCYGEIDNDACSCTGGCNNGEDIYNKVISQYPEIVLNLSGHIICTDEYWTTKRTDIVDGQSVHSVMSNWQNQPCDLNARLRFFEFHPGENYIYSYVYNPVEDSYYTTGGATTTFYLDFN